MSVWANGELIYGFINANGMKDLFDAISGDNEEDLAFSELHQDEQERHEITLQSVGYEGVDVLAAYSMNASGKGFDITSLQAEDLAKTEEYNQKIKSFLEAVGINPDLYTPGWHLLSYMD